MTDVVLVYPYFRTQAPTQLLFQPLGVACLAAQLKSRGLSVAVCDCTFLTWAEAMEFIIAREPAILGIHAMITLSAHAFRLARALRKSLPETLFVCGGPLPTLYPQRFDRCFDLVFRGESDLIFPDFCRDYLSLRSRRNFRTLLDPSGYPGLWLATPGGCVTTPPVHHSRPILDSLPLPDRSWGTHTAYQQFWFNKTGGKPASILLTRGCPFDCDFCSKPIFGRYFRTRSLDKIMCEITDIKNYGYDQLWIADDCFTLDSAFLREFCRSLERSKLGLKWTCLARADSLTDEVIRLMRRAGCIKVYLGLESGDDETLRLMNKKTTVAGGVAAVHRLCREGVQAGAFFLVGYPGETEASVKKTFSLALSLPLDEISFNVPFPLPGSALYSRVAGVDSSADWDVENETKFVFKSDFDPAWLKAEIEAVMRAVKDRASGRGPLP